MPSNTPAASTDRPVLKFGGAALVDGPGFRRAVEILARTSGSRPIVVVSAPGGVTSLLEEVALAAAAGRREGERVRIRLRTLLRQLGIESELLDRQLGQLFRVLDAVAARGELDPASRDFVLSIGERAAARVFARVLRDAGTDAAPIDSYDLGLLSDSNHGFARPVPGAGPRLRAALEGVPGIPVVTGFVAADRRGNLTTLGPNGSDWTAALIAEAVGAARVEFWKPVNGVYTADPAVIPEARRIPRLGYAQAAALSRAGAGVLHPDALLPLRRAHIPAVLRSFECPEAEGTTIGRWDHPGPVGVAMRLGLYHWTLTGARAATWAELLRRRRVESWAVEVRPDGTHVRAAAPAAVPDEVDACSGPFALVALVGADATLARRALEVLTGQGAVRGAWIGSDRESQEFAVDESDGARLLRELHALLEPGLQLEPDSEPDSRSAEVPPRAFDECAPPHSSVGPRGAAS